MDIQTSIASISTTTTPPLPVHGAAFIRRRIAPICPVGPRQYTHTCRVGEPKEALSLLVGHMARRRGRRSGIGIAVHHRYMATKEPSPAVSTIG